MWDVSNLVSSILFNVSSLQGMFANNDILEASFELINDGVIMLGAEQDVTKLNKSAELMLNTSS